MEELEQTAGAPPADSAAPTEPATPVQPDAPAAILTTAEPEPADSAATPDAPSIEVAQEPTTEGQELPREVAPAAPVELPTNVVARIDDLTVTAQASGNSAEHNLLTWLQVHLQGAKNVVARAEPDFGLLSTETQELFAHFKSIL